MQGIKISCQHKRSLYEFTKNRNDPKAKAQYIQYCKTLRKVIKLSSNITVSLTAKSNNTITTTWNILKKETGEVHSVEQFPIEVATDVANAFNNFFTIVTEKMNIQLIEKRDAI